MPYGRCVIYTFTGDAQEMIEKSRAGILPVLKEHPGFLAYGVMVQGEQIISMSAWDTEENARDADDVGKRWASENINAKVLNSFVGEYAWLEFAQR